MMNLDEPLISTREAEPPTLGERLDDIEHKAELALLVALGAFLLILLLYGERK
jgi:hypothetical protein